VPEIALEFGVGVGGEAEGVHLHDLGVVEGLGMAFHVTHHRLNQVLRFAATRSEKDVVSPPDMGKYLVLGGKFFGVEFLPVFE